MTINFKTDQYKLLNSIIYILQKIGKTDKHKICKILFYADKNHLNKYGRPITGDNYIKMNNGPVPSFIYDMLKLQEEEIEETFLKEIKKCIKTTKPYNVELSNKKVVFDDKYFSETDLEELDNAIEFCKNKSFSELTNLTHNEKAWINAIPNTGMDFALLLDDDNKNKQDILADLTELSNYMVL